jgi:CARDB protein
MAKSMRPCRRTAGALGTTLALACASGAHAYAAPPASQLATATLSHCVAAVDEPDRSATFAGQVLASADTTRMAVRVEVQERLGGEAYFHTVSAPGLGVWRASQPGVKIYKFYRQVTNLPAPAEFRARIDFRWLGAKGRLIRHTSRLTPTCEQPDERPKLTVGEVSATAVDAQTADYQIALRNEGRAASGTFTLALSVDGAPQPPLAVESLQPQSSLILAVTAPRCAPAGQLAVEPDPGHQVAEAPAGGLPRSFPCPLGG